MMYKECAYANFLYVFDLHMIVLESKAYFILVKKYIKLYTFVSYINCIKND